MIPSLPRAAHGPALALPPTPNSSSKEFLSSRETVIPRGHNGLIAFCNAVRMDVSGKFVSLSDRLEGNDMKMWSGNAVSKGGKKSHKANIPGWK